MKKVPLSLWLMLAAACILLISGFMLTSRVFANHIFVQEYKNGEYDTDKEEGLLSMNFPEGFLPYYNLGNAAFKKGDYNQAVSYYTEALKRNPSGENDCLVRINLALSMCYSIDFENISTQEQTDAAIKILEGAKAVLLENECALESGDGHNPDAQKLKEDIDNMIEELKNEPQSGSGEDNKTDPDNSKPDQNNGSGDYEKELKRKLEESRKESMKEGMETQNMMDNWSGFNGENSVHDENYDWESKKW